MNIMFHTGSLDKGGAERVISNLSNYLDNENNNVCILVSRLDKIGYSLNNEVKVEVLNPSKIQNFFVKNMIIFKNIIKNIKIYKPDVIVCFLNEPSIRTLFLKKLHLVSKNIKIIISVRNDPKKIYNTPIKKLIMKTFFKTGDGFVFQTIEAKNFFSKEVKEKSIIIPNPINTDFIGNFYKGKRKKTIITVGRLTEQKNHLLLIDAYYRVQLIHPEYILKIYGEGNLKNTLLKHCLELKIEDKVLFMGVVDNIKDEIYDDGVFVLSSNYEGMPNALMEAMTLGLPCISTDCPCGGPRFLIENDKNGILVPVGNQEKLEMAIKKVINDNEFASKIGMEAHKISKVLNPNVINKKWKKYLDDICYNTR